MELRVTMCPSPGPSHPRAAPLRVPGCGCTHPRGLAWDAGPPGPLVRVLVPSTLVLALACTQVLQTLRVPVPSLAGTITQGALWTPKVGRGAALPRGRWAVTRFSQSADPSPALSPDPGTCGMCLHPVCHVHLLSKISFSLLFLPFLFFRLSQTGLIISAKKLLTGACGGAGIGPPLIFTLNN